ncbi:beta-class carbonic anhydrase [Enterococcus eurekensis]|jgi:carbonic anhydrase|uniref:carbonic anhydrase n=2 Tax=Enterococcus TaxID=1350 RepID=A0ABV9M8A7_9ENTE|nr:carbonic anhydrase [Candidatus Enterococcus avicola]
MKQVFQDILSYNEAFVENKEYLPYQTDSNPNKKLAILTCMDSRLTELLPAALGIKNGDAKTIKNAGGMITSPVGSTIRSLVVSIYAFDIKQVMVIGHDDCGMSHVDNSPLLEKMKDRGISKEAFETFNSDSFDTARWLEGFDNVEESVAKTVDAVINHPLISKDVEVRGFVINPNTGKLRIVK